nr:peptidoglycan-binding protein [Herpetosiphonaceae bacterium]
VEAGDKLYSMLPQLRLNVQAALGTVGRTWPVVARGSTAITLVKTVQNQLKAKGYAVTVDGQFGPGTETAVKSFQRSQGELEDGIVGMNTWNRLVK